MRPRLRRRAAAHTREVAQTRANRLLSVEATPHGCVVLKAMAAGVHEARTQTWYKRCVRVCPLGPHSLAMSSDGHNHSAIVAAVASRRRRTVDSLRAAVGACARREESLLSDLGKHGVVHVVCWPRIVLLPVRQCRCLADKVSISTKLLFCRLAGGKR